jgi:hypothetical protein
MSVPETLSKIEMYKVCESVARKLEWDMKVKPMKDVRLEQGLQILSRNPEQIENKNVHTVQNKSESRKLKINLKSNFQESGVNSLKHSSHSRAPTCASDGRKPLRCMLKPILPSALAHRSARKSTNSLLGESDADCKMFSSVNLEANSSEDITNGVVSKEANEMKTKGILSTSFRTLREHEPVQQNIQPGNNLCNIIDSQSNEIDTELLSNQTESSKCGTVISIEQDGVKNLEQALIDNAELDKETVESEKIDESKVESMDSLAMKLKTPSKSTSINESDNVVSEVSEVEPVTSIHNSVLPVLSAENSKNQWPDDNTSKSVPLNMSKMLQHAETKLPVSRITESSDVVNSVDQTNCSVTVKRNGDAAQQKQLQIVNGSESVGEQRTSADDKEDSAGQSSEIVHENIRNMSLPVTGNETAAVLLTEHSPVVPQEGCKEVNVHGKEVEEGEAVVCGKGSTEKCALLTVTRNKDMAPVSEAEFECGVEDTESDAEEKHVQTSLMIEAGGKEMVTAVSEIEYKGVLELKDTESDPEAKHVQTSLMIETVGKEMVTAVSDMEYKGALELKDTESDAEEKRVQTALIIETGGKEMVTAVSEMECKGALELKDTESDAEEKRVQAALMIETGGKEMVTVVSEMECKGTLELKDTESDAEEKRVQTSLMIETGGKEMVTAVSEMECKGTLELGGEDKSTSSSTLNESASKDCSVWTVTDTVTTNGGNKKILPSVAQVSETVDTKMAMKIQVTAASELGCEEKPSLYKEFTSLPGQDCVKSAGSEEMIIYNPETDNSETPVPIYENEEGSTVLLEAVTCVSWEDHVRTKTTGTVLRVSEESSTKITVPEADSKEEPTSVPKAAMYVPDEQCIKQAALETEVLSDDPAPIVPDVASVEVSSFLHETKCEELNGEGYKEAEKPVPKARLSLLKIGCKAEGSQCIERNVCNETALSVTNEVNFPLSVVEKSTLHPRNNFEVSSVQEGLLIESPVQSSEDMPQVEIKIQPELNQKELPVSSSSSEVETVHHLQPISLSENKENLPVTTVNTSVLEHSKSSGSSAGNTRPQPLNDSPVTQNLLTQNVLEETLVVPWEEVSRTETNKFNISCESGRPEANVETLASSVSVNEAVDSPQPIDLQNHLQGASNGCDTSIMIQAKNNKICNKELHLVESTSKVVKLSTACGIRSRKNDNSICSTVRDKSRCVTKCTKKSVMSKSGNLKKQAETSYVDDRGAKLGNTKMQEKSSPTSVRNCDILSHSEAAVSRSSSKHKNCGSLDHSEAAVIPALSKRKHCDRLLRSEKGVSRALSKCISCDRLVQSKAGVSQASLKCVKESDLSTSDPQSLAFEVTKVTSEKTLCDSVKSDKYLKESTMPDEPFLHARSNQTVCKKNSYRMLKDSLLTCLKASARLDGK